MVSENRFAPIGYDPRACCSLATNAERACAEIVLELSRVESRLRQVDFGQAATAVLLACPDMAAGSTDEIFDRSKICENPIRALADRLAARGPNRDHDAICSERLAGIRGDGLKASR